MDAVSSDEDKRTIDYLRGELEKLKRHGYEKTPPVLVDAVPVIDTTAEVVPALKLDLGSGPRPRDGYKGVDNVAGVTDFTFDLISGDKWPWDDASVDELHSSHFIEHIEKGNRHVTYSGQGNLFYFFFEEAFRIIKPGGKLLLQWPALQSVRAFQDATHCDYIPIERMYYLSRDTRRAMGVEHYGARCNWVMETGQPILTPAAAARTAEVQQRLYLEAWNVSQDFMAVLRADK